MAEANKKTRKRAPQTVRQRSETENSAKPKRRIVRNTATGISKPFRLLASYMAKIFRPLSFLLIPFKTKPFRILGRILAAIFFLRYFRASWQELKQVTWPGRKETINLTLSVFAFAIIFGVLISVVDFSLDKVFKALILK